MKKILFVLFLWVSSGAQAQLIVNLQTPPAGLVFKPQLWTMALTNTTNTTLTVYVELVLTELSTGQQTLSAVSSDLLLPGGTTQLNASRFGTIQYTVLGIGTGLDANPNGLLPLGHYEACFYIFRRQNDASLLVKEECIELVIEPLGPVQLVYPGQGTAIPETLPLFSWLPPVPVQQFSSLSYDIWVVEVLPTQSPADAITANASLYTGTSLTAPQLLYPQSAPVLVAGKEYAWRVAVKQNGSVVGFSETWPFTRKDFGQVSPPRTPELPFVKLRKEQESGYALFFGELKLDYFNETADSTWNLQVTNLSRPDAQPLLLQTEGPLKRGQNLLRIPLSDHSYFIDKHFYSVEVRNSRKETWYLRFQYRQPQPLN